ncbi:hypothetical protein Tco_0002163 [Tanacetum coccineum]
MEPPSQDPYVAKLGSLEVQGLTARPSSSSEFPIAPVTAMPGIRRRSAILIRPGEAIPFGRPYRTHLNGPQPVSAHESRTEGDLFDMEVWDLRGFDMECGGIQGNDRNDLKGRIKGIKGKMTKERLFDPDVAGQVRQLVVEEIVEPGLWRERRGRIVWEWRKEEIPSDSFFFPWHSGMDDGNCLLVLRICRLTWMMLAWDFYLSHSERVSMIERIDSLRLENLKVRAMLDIERNRVNSLRLSHVSFTGGVLSELEERSSSGERELHEIMTEVVLPKNRNEIGNEIQDFQVELTNDVYTKMVPEENPQDYKMLRPIFYSKLPTNLMESKEYWRSRMLLEPFGFGNIKKNGYEGTLPFCNKCKLHHEGQCTIKCNNCMKVRNMTRGLLRHKDITARIVPKSKHKTGNTQEFLDARGKAYVLGGGNANPGSNTVTESSSFLYIGMDWLAKNHAVIVCDEKIVRIPYENEILIVQGDKSDKEKKSTLSIISCEKAQKYMEKGCQNFSGGESQVVMQKEKVHCLCIPANSRILNEELHDAHDLEIGDDVVVFSLSDVETITHYGTMMLTDLGLLLAELCVVSFLFELPTGPEPIFLS